jgi:hypothetical protein
MSGPTRECAGNAGAGDDAQALARLIFAGRGVREQRARRQDGHAHQS